MDTIIERIARGADDAPAILAPDRAALTHGGLRRLMAETARQRSRTGLRPLTYATLIGLLAATGLRPGEALALDTADVDLDAGLLTIRQSKFGKSRVVPVDDSTREALGQYLTRRTALCARPQSPAFLLSEHGRRLRGRRNAGATDARAQIRW